MNNRYFTVCGIVEIGGRVLLVRHTYGQAEGRILLPGGYVKEDELPARAACREILEETGVVTAPEEVFSIQFKPDQWCVVFRLRYVSGEPRSDGFENSEVMLLAPEEAVIRPDITNMSRVVLEAYIKERNGLQKSGYVSRTASPETYELYLPGKN